MIGHYTYGKEKAPQSFEELVSSGYLKKLPLDPITNSELWKTENEDVSQAINQAEPGIFEVHSTSDKTSQEGTTYSGW